METRERSVLRKNNNNPPQSNQDSSPKPGRYRECLKNHGVKMGAHILDGCGEFMPAIEDALKCAACECHRSFHRQESHHITPPPRVATSQHHRPDLAVPSTMRQQRHPMPPIMMAFGGANGTPAESSSEDYNMFQTYANKEKKRFRTKFSQEQKDKMLVFAERVGWKIQKEDEQEILRFCDEVGLKKQVFKVWMHNNKQDATKKK